MAIAVSIMLLPAMRVLASGGVRTWFVHPFSQDTVMLFGPALVGNCAGGGRYSLVAMIIWAIMSEVALMTALQREQADFAAKFG